MYIVYTYTHSVCVGLSECSVEGAMHGQMRVLAACYAVTLAALIAGAPQAEIISHADEEEA